MFFIFVNRQRRPVLGDTGCSSSCISHEFFAANPFLRRSFVPIESTGTAINGSPVNAVGEIRLGFELGGSAMSITCKVIKGLMDPIVLGWDWMCKYNVMMDAANGKVHYLDGKSQPLLDYDLPFMG